LALGEPVAEGDLAAGLGRPTGEIGRILDAWPSVERDERRRVVGFWGLGLAETPHRLKVGGRTLFTWCAWDTLFIPGLLNREARVSSACADSGQPITLTVGAQGVRELVPPTAVLSFLTPPSRFGDDTRRRFCEHIRFFSDADRYQRHQPQAHPRTFALPVEDGFWLGRLTSQALFGAALGDRGDERGRARMPPAIEVVVLYTDGCPHWHLVEARIRAALRRLGADNAAVSARRVESVEEARRLRLRGSPTVLIDGRDPFAGADDDAAQATLACRLYDGPGGLAGAPTAAQLEAALRDRLSGGGAP
ncbi:MAG: organomercurial lyase, partial [Gemmatimonadales bacterium]